MSSLSSLWIVSVEECEEEGVIILDEYDIKSLGIDPDYEISTDMLGKLVSPFGEVTGIVEVQVMYGNDALLPTNHFLKVMY